ncbi:Hypothetical predicted protein [Mytilus galloprovincialis]|uniref:Uncharacterized protein n=1 Tax=Mytilus galloprovincialis TaxID=29158 RepID=A0A8B6DKG1_MYTGA|nr:Hypothetical predicted protein [Mytilus galloprovincialis]
MKISVTLSVLVVLLYTFKVDAHPHNSHEDDHDSQDEDHDSHEDHHHDHHQSYQECAKECQEHSQQQGFNMEGCMQHCDEFHPDE